MLKSKIYCILLCKLVEPEQQQMGFPDAKIQSRKVYNYFNGNLTKRFKSNTSTLLVTLILTKLHLLSSFFLRVSKGSCKMKHQHRVGGKKMCTHKHPR